MAAELGVELVATPDQVGALRQIKDQYEIGLLREACEISQRALQRLMLEVRVGTSERMVAARLEFLMREEGADAAAFSTIVATGSSSAEPHHEPTDRVIERGDLLKIDFGARWQGYHADMTRTFVVGAPASAWHLEVHRLVAEAAGAGRAAVAPGVEAREVDAAARRVIDAAGYGQNFGHGIGHGGAVAVGAVGQVGLGNRGCTPGDAAICGNFVAERSICFNAGHGQVKGVALGNAVVVT